MRILMVSHEYPPVGGGGANACMFLAREYAAAGHEVAVVTAWYEGLAPREDAGGVEIYRLRARRAHKECCGFGEMLSYLAKALPFADGLAAEGRFDVCQVFFGIPSGPVGLWLKKRRGVPYIIRFGGGDIPGFQRRFRLLYKAVGPAVKWIWSGADALVANSRGLREFALRFHGGKDVGVIHNGVDTDFFRPDYSKRGGGAVELLFVSRLIERKGLQHLIPRLEEVRALAGRDVRLTVVGDGPYRQALEEAAALHGVGGMVRFEGQRGKEELPAYYQAADVFVFPSMREGMPNAVLEAMACGLPIVMTPCEGSGELVDGNGFVTGAEGFPEAVARCVREQGALSRRSRELAEDVFSWKKSAAAYLSMMEGACARAGSAQKREGGMDAAPPGGAGTGKTGQREISKS